MRLNRMLWNLWAFFAACGLQIMASEVTATAARIDDAPTETLIAPGQLSETALKAVQALFANKEGLESKIELVHEPNPLKIKPGEYTLQAELPQTLQAGLHAVRVTVMRNRILLTSTEVTLRIRIFQNMPVAAHAAGMNQTLGTDDVTLESREIKPNMGKLIDPNAMAGQRLRIPVQQGQILEDRLFQPVPVIKKGDRVLIVMQRGVLFISTTAESQGEAGVGQNVRVKFLDTGAELYVKASGPGQAEM